MSGTLSRTTLYACAPAAAVLVLVAGPASPAAAGIDPLSGIDFVHITDPGNAPWMGNGTPGDRAIGRGGVNYNYHIGRMEVTTGQWVEFFNAAFDRPDPLPHLIPPTFWGAVGTTPNTPGGRRWTVPAGNENRFVGNIDWRMAAMYCNWLHNGKNTDRAAFLDGAYDASTFGYVDGIFTDQLEHHPGARYWIPTWDEWLKAAHYDPDKNGPGQGGWWIAPDESDDRPASGPPGIGEANIGWDPRDYPDLAPPTATLLGAYPSTQSPWGLLDVAGATTEWTEAVFAGTGGVRVRILEGSNWTGGGLGDLIYTRASEFPNVSTGDFGFRIASAVPAPSTGTALGCVAFLLALRRRRASGAPY